MTEFIQSALTHFAACSSQSSFLGFPTWYKYIKDSEELAGRCTPKIDFLGDPTAIAGIALAIAEMLLIIAGIAAVGFVMYGGFRYLISQGEPENTRAAQQTVINALIGLFIAILATGIVRFIGGNLH